MPTPKATIVAQLNDKELELLQKAQAYQIVNQKSSSVRTILMLGVYEIVGLDIQKDS
jgi:hypothetical protein